MPMIKVFAFSESQTFCVAQYDQHIGTDPEANYHTKYRLSYYKFPIKNQIIKPLLVFKTHTGAKEYGYFQTLVKLNNHSMVGSLGYRMDQNNETMLKTYDFRNNPMGI